MGTEIVTGIGESPAEVAPVATNGATSVILIGNPNVGKSVIFSLITGKYVTVSNYPGTTVEVTKGTSTVLSRKLTVVDTPGVHTLLPISEDEKVSRDILLHTPEKTVIQVVDAKNLRRSLLVTAQLVEMQVPMVLCLNMQDEARSRGIAIDDAMLSGALGVPVVSTVAVRREGLPDLVRAVDTPRRAMLQVTYPEAIETASRQIIERLPKTHIAGRSIALMFLAGDQSLQPWLDQQCTPEIVEQLHTIREKTKREFRKPLSVVLNEHRLAVIDQLMDLVYTRSTVSSGASIRSRLESWSCHPVYGFAMLGLVLWCMYWFVGVFGAGTAVDFVEGTIFGQYLNPWMTQFVTFLVPIPLIQDFIIGEFGLFTMAVSYSFAIILPIVATFFLAFSFLEDSGYLPRLAIMLNKVFTIIGLNGKAVLPMVLGLGCDTMATMTARILETKKERLIVTLLLALGVPCSAQLGVIGGMMTHLSIMAIVVWLGVVLGVMVLVGYLAALVIPGRSSDFILELPPFRVPRISNILIKTVARLEWYLREVVPLFLIATVVLFTLDALGGLTLLRDLAAPVVQTFLGLPTEAADAFLIGFFRRDYGAAGLYMLAREGRLDPIQIVVSIITITLFVPCIANVFMIIKEQGRKTAVLMVGFIFPFAFVVGGVVNQVLRYFDVQF